VAALNAFTAFDLAMGMISGLGLLYLLYVEEYVLSYRRFLLVTTAGLLVFGVGGPLFDIFDPKYVHVVHGVGALLVVLGMYDPIHHELRREDWADLLSENPAELRHSANWMVPMDDEILAVFHSADLVLTPMIVAYNTGLSRSEVNRRLLAMKSHGVVERVDRGKYRLTPLGEQYLQGERSAAALAEPTDAAI